MKCWPEDPASGEILGIFIFIASNSAHIQHPKVTPRHRLCIRACSALHNYTFTHKAKTHSSKLENCSEQMHCIDCYGAAWPGPDYDWC